MGIGKTSIVGHGLGALVGFAFCTRWPDSVDRMLAVNCPLSYYAINARVRTSSLQDLTHWLVGKPPEVKTAFADATKADPRAIQASLESFRSNNLFNKMRQTQIPCLLLHGKKDPRCKRLLKIPSRIYHIQCNMWFSRNPAISR
jgi:pimeloyl-ACP methyl ester carboxylesterase